MKKFLVGIMAAALFVCMVTGCSANTVDVFRLDHYNGVAEDGATDSKYFYRNDFSLITGDSQVIWVSEEQDDEYGGYYYQYASMCDGVLLENFGGDDPHRSAITCFRSKDLNEW